MKTSRLFLLSPRALMMLCLLAIVGFLSAFSVDAREAGWVPIPKGGSDIRMASPAKPPAGVLPAREKTPIQTSAAPTPSPPSGSVYDNQPPVTEAEIQAFLILLPQFRSWSRKNGEEAHPVVNASGQPDFMYSPNAAQWVVEHGMAAPRFFCTMGRLAAGLAIIEEGNDYKETRPRDMPEVTPAELNLVRRHLEELLNAGNPPPR